LNYFQWNNPGAIGAAHEVVGNQSNPFMHMFETRTELFQVLCAQSAVLVMGNFPASFEIFCCSPLYLLKNGIMMPQAHR
jgi:hypothetical protein